MVCVVCSEDINGFACVTVDIYRNYAAQNVASRKCPYRRAVNLFAVISAKPKSEKQKQRKAVETSFSRNVADRKQQKKNKHAQYPKLTGRGVLNTSAR